MKKNASLSAFGFFTLTAAMLMSADEYPAFAQSGLMATLVLVAGGTGLCPNDDDARME